MYCTVKNIICLLKFNNNFAFVMSGMVVTLRGESIKVKMRILRYGKMFAYSATLGK